MKARRTSIKTYTYSFGKLLSEFWFVPTFIAIYTWAQAKLYFIGGLSDEPLITVLSVFSYCLFLIPLLALWVLWKTELVINERGIFQRNFLRRKEIRWGEVVSMKKVHFYQIMPDLSEPVDIEIRGSNKTVICVNRFLEDFAAAEENILRYSKRDFNDVEEKVEPSWRKVFMTGIMILLVAFGFRFATDYGGHTDREVVADGMWSHFISFISGVHAVFALLLIIGVIWIYMSFRMRRQSKAKT